MLPKISDMIPFVDLNAQYNSIKQEIDTAIQDCVSGGNFIKGKIITDFENAFAGFLGIDHCLCCGNGTDALEIILAALGIGKDDEVIVPALTWISTSEAVNNVGAEPVFVDVNRDTYTIDCTRIEEKISSRTRAIIPVHLYGSPTDMNEIMALADKYGLHVIEDCAQAHGAEYCGRKVGTFGVASAFSFFPSKNLGAFGDGGAIVTNNNDLAVTVRKISNHGQLNKKHSHSVIGRNSRLDSIQASVLLVKLKYLNGWNQRRREAASYYLSSLQGIDSFVLPYVEQIKTHVYHLFVIRCDNRGRLIELLDEKNISWGIHYPNPLPFVEAYTYKNHKHEDFAVSHEITKKIISIPIYPEITEEQQNLICSQLLKYDK
jgi:dTDP-4-amino-4,6-dideoxygalactose transaminase